MQWRNDYYSWSCFSPQSKSKDTLLEKDEYHGFEGIGSLANLLIKVWGVALKASGNSGRRGA